MKTNALLILLAVLSIFYHSEAYAQNRIQLLGTVKDTTKVGIPSASIRLIAGKDTLNTTTDSAGRFRFTDFKGDTFLLMVRSIGYLPYYKNYTIKTGHELLQLPLVTLQADPLQLKEVRIKGKILPVRVMQDTVEYNASSYAIHDQDRVEDLLKQLPGMVIDKDGNVTASGKPLTKIRVNGKDFFTGNVKEFISRLPAGLVDKIQVVDDYGDEANFTGIKEGEPQKLLNVVLKSNKNSGTFGNVSANAGTSDRYGLSFSDYVWKNTKQIGINGNGTNLNNGTGMNTNVNTGVNYRDKFGKKLVLSGGYNFGYDHSANAYQNYRETISSMGTLYTQSSSESVNKVNNHNLYLGMQSQDKDDFMRGNITGTLIGTVGNSIYDSQQSGLIRQNLNSINHSDTHVPVIDADFNLSHKLKKKGRLISMTVKANSGKNHNSNDSNNQIGYFNPTTGEPLKDSLLNQLVDSRNRNLSLNAVFTYTEPLGNLKDSLIKKHLDLSYNFSFNHNSTGLETSAIDNNGLTSRIDSLSNRYSSAFIQHTLGATYRYDTKKLNYSLGINAQPYLLTGGYDGQSAKINRPGFTLFPVARLNFIPSKANVFSFYYTENTVRPNLSQLQPVPNTQNLQNVVIGNPDLKAALNHIINLSYRHVNTGNGSALQLGIGGSATQNKVVSNTILIPDTLNGLKQQTRYQNTNGNYGTNGNYLWTLPLDKNKYTIQVRGILGYDHRVSFSDGMKNFSNGVNINQSAGLKISQKWVTLNTELNYSYVDNSYSLASTTPNRIQTWVVSGDTRFFITGSLRVSATAVKTVNSGYSLPGANTLILGGNVEKMFLKSKQISLKFEANDVLNQTNNLNRTISDNTISESRSNQISRYFILSFSWRPENFDF
ncbi:TonB-dependent receptor [Pedobacter sp. L105]|uniref:TonB-dependent receptor n=1 Tax=Pedobacter sp. L105 TaxID=1641871 RepID=UPI00131DFDBF|nr:TonB-dependent receptor [Pedobacter sp. L105]